MPLFGTIIQPFKIFKKASHLLFQVKFNVASNWRHNKDLLVGSVARDLLDDSDLNLKPEKVEKFYKSVLPYFTTVCEYLVKKLPWDNPLLSAVTVLDPARKLQQDSVQHITYLCNRFSVLCTDVETGLSCKDKIIEDFTSYQIDNSVVLKDDERVDMYWNEVVQVLGLPALGRFVAGLLTVPHSSAPCERIFSCVRKKCHRSKSQSWAGLHGGPSCCQVKARGLA